MFVDFLFARNRTKDVSIFAHELLPYERCFAVAAPEALWLRVPRESVVIKALRSRRHFSLAGVANLRVDIVVAFHAVWPLILGHVFLSGQKQVARLTPEVL